MPRRRSRRRKSRRRSRRRRRSNAIPTFCVKLSGGVVARYKKGDRFAELFKLYKNKRTGKGYEGRVKGAGGERTVFEDLNRPPHARYFVKYNGRNYFLNRHTHHERNCHIYTSRKRRRSRRFGRRRRRRFNQLLF